MSLSGGWSDGPAVLKAVGSPGWDMVRLALGKSVPTVLGEAWRQEMRQPQVQVIQAWAWQIVVTPERRRWLRERRKAEVIPHMVSKITPKWIFQRQTCSKSSCILDKQPSNWKLGLIRKPSPMRLFPEQLKAREASSQPPKHSGVTHWYSFF